MRLLIACLVALFAGFPAGAQEWRDPDLGGAAREGVATTDHIWLLGASGKVVRFARRSGEREVVAENARDLLAVNGKVWVLTQGDDQASYSLRDLRLQDSAPDAEAANHRIHLHPAEFSEGDVLGMFAWPDEDRPAILASRAVVVPVPEGWKRWRLAASLATGASIATPDGRNVYVGYNRGEWGGGLRRIDVFSGAISIVSAAGDDRCGGAINPQCEPVVGLFPDRETPDCLTVGTGLSHLGLSFGRVYRVCGGDISNRYSTPAPARSDGWMMGPQPWPFDSLVETTDGWIGLSRDRYFRSRGGRVEERPMPTLNEWSGIRVSEEEDGVLFVVSACCWGSAANPTLYRALALPVRP